MYRGELVPVGRSVVWSLEVHLVVHRAARPQEVRPQQRLRVGLQLLPEQLELQEREEEEVVLGGKLEEEEVVVPQVVLQELLVALLLDLQEAVLLEVVQAVLEVVVVSQVGLLGL